MWGEREAESPWKGAGVVAMGLEQETEKNEREEGAVVGSIEWDGG